MYPKTILASERINNFHLRGPKRRLSFTDAFANIITRFVAKRRFVEAVNTPLNTSTTSRLGHDFSVWSCTIEYFRFRRPVVGYLKAHFWPPNIRNFVDVTDRWSAFLDAATGRYRCESADWRWYSFHVSIDTRFDAGFRGRLLPGNYTFHQRIGRSTWSS